VCKSDRILLFRLDFNAFNLFFYESFYLLFCDFILLVLIVDVCEHSGKLLLSEKAVRVGIKYDKVVIADLPSHQSASLRIFIHCPLIISFSVDRSGGVTSWIDGPMLLITKIISVIVKINIILIEY
jgi:hypothetical protein